jgi:hypothetical protein
MPMLPARNYVSDHTQFINKLLSEKPDILRKQREGREIWWDKTPDELVERSRMDERRVPQPAYVYDTE